MRQVSWFASGALVVGALALAGCAQQSSMSSSAQPSGKTMSANLSTSQEVPPVAGNGSGKADFTLDPSSKQLTWKVTYDGLSGPATAAHIHGPAAAGANAGVVVPLTAQGAPVTSPITGSTTLTDQQIADLTNGMDYVNIHTANNKGGEIRGQIR
jgi:hypothetical protein